MDNLLVFSSTPEAPVVEQREGTEKLVQRVSSPPRWYEMEVTSGLLENLIGPHREGGQLLTRRLVRIALHTRANGALFLIEMLRVSQYTATLKALLYLRLLPRIYWLEDPEGELCVVMIVSRVSLLLHLHRVLHHLRILQSRRANQEADTLSM